MGVGEVFRSATLGDKLACRRTSRLSALSPGYEDDDIDLAYLPAAFWMLGLGNLGQAALWTIGLLPYSDPGLISLYLQDVDASELGNLAIQVLTKPGWIGRKKARSAAPWGEERGFRTTIIESRFVKGTKHWTEEPGLALVGVDNLAARRAAAGPNFDLLVDAGLGATPSEIFDIRIHGFPGTRSPKQAWPEPDFQPEMPLDPTLQELVDAGRIDRCGAVTIAGRSLGVPSTAVAAAAIRCAGLPGRARRRLLRSGRCDTSQLSSCDRPSARLGQAGNPAFPAGQERILIASPVTEMHRCSARLRVRRRGVRRAAKRRFRSARRRHELGRDASCGHRGQDRAGAGGT
jgi:hypothetical protein